MIELFVRLSKVLYYFLHYKQWINESKRSKTEKLFKEATVSASYAP